MGDKRAEYLRHITSTELQNPSLHMLFKDPLPESLDDVLCGLSLGPIAPRLLVFRCGNADVRTNCAKALIASCDGGEKHKQGRRRESQLMPLLRPLLGEPKNMLKVITKDLAVSTIRISPPGSMYKLNEEIQFDINDDC